MAAAGTATALLGRDALLDFIWAQCLDRPGRDAPELPVVAVLGPRGSGKTAVLDCLAASCREQPAQPFAPVLSLAAGGFDHAWQLIDMLARQLSAQPWPQFGRLRFPRFALGRILAEGAVRTDALEHTQKDIEVLLRQAAGLDEAAAQIRELTAQLPQFLGLARWLGAFGQLGALAVSSRLMTRLRLRTGMAFYGTALRAQANGGYLALGALTRLSCEASPDSRAVLDRVLCEAFLADLAEEYSRGFRPRNCLVLIDNIDDDARLGEAFLTALCAARSARSGAPAADPLLVVVTSRRTTPVAALLDAAAGQPMPAEARLRPDGAAGLADWQASRSGAGDWLYPLRLRDLDRDQVLALAQQLQPGSESCAGFVHSLTGGHPWGVRETLATLAALRPPGPGGWQLGEDALRGVLEAPCPGRGGLLGDVAVRELLLADLPRTVQARMPACAAALDLATAQRAGLPRTSPLESELARLLWLADGPPAAGLGASLHPWPRRLLLRKLAPPAPAPDHGTRGRRPPARRPAARRGTGGEWAQTFEALREAAADQPAQACHYEVALCQFGGAVGWLAERFARIGQPGQLTADAWLAEFNLITSAAREHPSRPSAAQCHAGLVADLDKAGVLGDPAAAGAGGQLAALRRQAIGDLAAARWIWADPLGDPLLTLNPILASGFLMLAMGSPGERRLTAEADFYRRGGRPGPRPASGRA